MSVNVAGSQLQHARFVQDVLDVLRDTGLSPARLVLEVTESALIEDTEGNVLKLEQLRAAGIRLAIDDFGTGYSSLSYLRQFSLDMLKIDKSFVDTLGRDSKGTALVAAMVAMGTSLGMEVVAEGIEDQAQLRRSPDPALLLRPRLSLREAGSGRRAHGSVVEGDAPRERSGPADGGSGNS